MTVETVDLAVRALEAFGRDLTRAQAGMLLPLWRYYTDLTAAERHAVLSRFPGRIIESSHGPGGVG